MVLAAGASRRFGSPKQLVRLHGRPRLHAAVSRAVEVAGHSVTVVLCAHAAELAALLKHSPAAVAINRNWQDGLASSVRTGIASVPGSVDAVLLMLADQPSVSAEDLRRLASLWRRQSGNPAAASYAGSAGVPAIFPREFFRDLSELRGDRGAKQILLRYPDRVQRVAMPSAAIDIDTPEDLLNIPDTAPGPAL